MLRNILVQLYLFLQPLLGLGQSLPDTLVSPLPGDLKECSGMTLIDDTTFVLINDGGNEAELFLIDTLGQVQQTIALIGIPNRDWESVAYADGLLYIGDFGNNANKRTDLEIFVLDISKLQSAQTWSLKGSIPFQYPEQSEFPAAEERQYYDLEAMIVERDSLFLFTKNRTKPFDGLVKVYGLSTETKKQDAKLIKEFKTNVGLKHFNWVSGASLGPNGNDLFLLGYSKIWYVENWRHTHQTDLYSYRLKAFSQKEALALRGRQLYMAQEKSPNAPQSLRKVDVSLFLNRFNQLIPEAYELKHSRLSSKDTLDLVFQKPRYFIGENYALYNQTGEAVKQGVISEESLRKGGLQLALNGLPPGTYVLSIEGPFKRAFIIQISL